MESSAEGGIEIDVDKLMVFLRVLCFSSPFLVQSFPSTRGAIMAHGVCGLSSHHGTRSRLYEPPAEQYVGQPMGNKVTCV